MHGLQCGFQVMGRLIEDQRIGIVLDRFQHFLLFPAGLGQETNKGEAGGIQPRTDQCRQARISPRQRRYPEAGFDGQACQMAARITDARQTGIADADQVMPLPHIFDQFRPLGELVVLMVAGELRMDVKMRQQLPGMPSILGSNQFDLA